jgi:hypothetical protein
VRSRPGLLSLVVVALLAAVAVVPAGAAERAGVPSGIGPVKVGMKRGPLRNAKGKPLPSVTAVLGASTKNTESENVPVSQDGSGPTVPVYITEYPSKGLSVYYQRVGKVGKGLTGPKDKVVGVVAFEKRYGLPIGETFDSSNCVSLEETEAPDGGPPRVIACFVHGGATSEVLYMSASSPSRAGQTVAGVGIFLPGIEATIHRGIIEEANEIQE